MRDWCVYRIKNRPIDFAKNVPFYDEGCDEEESNEDCIRTSPAWGQPCIN